MSEVDTNERVQGEPARRRRYLAASVCLALAACSPPIRQYDIRDRPLSCDDANRLTYRTLEAMRFKVTDFAPAAPGERGVIKASRAASGDGDRSQTVTATITCAPSGAAIDASEDYHWLDQLDFKRAFYQSFVNVESMHAGRTELDKENLAGTAPESQQRRDLKVIVTPQRGQSAKLDFAFDLDAAGVLPIRIDISNLTERTYTIDPSAVRLTRADRERVVALTPAAAAAQIAGAVHGDPPRPVTTLSRDAIAAALAQHALSAAAVAPGT
ncbi:MAG: hypothetical protein ACRD1V_14810 [Vicinamibacterales bacterium]